MSESNGNGKRWQPTISLGNVLQIIAAVGSVGLVYANMSSRIAALESKLDLLTSWVMEIAQDNHPFEDDRAPAARR